MKRFSRAGVAVSIIALAMIAGIAWSYFFWVDSRGAAESAASDFVACRKLAEQIESLKKKPSLAVSRELQVTELSGRLEAALAKADLAAEDLVRVSAETARRVGDTAYLERETQLTLRDVSLRQVILFLTTLAADGSGLSVSGIRLTASRGVGSEGDWAAELAVSYLVYAPRSDVASGRTE